MQVLPEIELLTEGFCQWLSFTIKESKTWTTSEFPFISINQHFRFQLIC
jgi:hypothetical protein